jgi:hypothetical protein
MRWATRCAAVVRRPNLDDRRHEGVCDAQVDPAVLRQLVDIDEREPLRAVGVEQTHVAVVAAAVE